MFHEFLLWETGSESTVSGGLRRALQHRPFEQCHRLHHAEGHAGGASEGDSRRAGSQAGGSQATTAESSPAGSVKSEEARFMRALLEATDLVR